MAPLVTIWVAEKKSDIELLKVIADPVNCRDIKRIFRLRIVKLTAAEHAKIKKRKYDTPLMFDGRNKIFGGQPILTFLQKIIDKKYQVASSRKGKANSMHDMMMRTLRESDDNINDDMNVDENLREKAERAAEDRKKYHNKYGQTNNHEPVRKPNTWEEQRNAPQHNTQTNNFRENIQPAPLGQDEQRLIQRGQSSGKRKLRDQQRGNSRGKSIYNASSLSKDEQMLRDKMGL